MSVPFNSCSIALRASGVSGWVFLENLIPKHNFSNSIYDAMDDLEDQYSDWDSDQGFGSSDSTFAIKYFIDSMIKSCGLGAKLKTVFSPSLSIVEVEKVEIKNDKI